MARAGLSRQPRVEPADVVEAGARLARRPAAEIAAVLAAACRRWADPADEARGRALDALAGHYRVPRTAVAEPVDAGFGAWTEAALLGWLEELGGPEAVDGFAPTAGGRRGIRPPRLVTVLAAHGVPTTPVGDLLAALLVKAPVWLKPAAGADDLVDRFATALAEVDPAIGAAAAVVRTASDDPDLERALSAADVVVATGRAATLDRVRERLGPDARLVAHGPRLSVALVGAAALAAERTAIVEALAADAAFGGQLGCLSPVAVYVEAPWEAVAGLVDDVHAACTRHWPAGPRRAAGIGERAAFAAWAGTVEVEVAAGRRIRWAGEPGSGWTVVAREGARPPEPPPVPRFVELVAVDEPAAAIAAIAAARGRISTVGVAAPEPREAELAVSLAQVGVERVCRLGRMQRPAVGWWRDGRPTLVDLVKWVGWEGA